MQNVAPPRCCRPRLQCIFERVRVCVFCLLRLLPDTYWTKKEKKNKQTNNTNEFTMPIVCASVWDVTMYFEYYKKKWIYWIKFIKCYN